MAGITIQEEIVVKGIVSQEELQVPFRVGVDGITFTPSVSSEGVISWTNDGDKDNPTPVNIKGQQGDNVEFRTSGGFVQWKPISGTTWTNLISIAELAQLETTTGQSTTKGMTQKSITDELANKVSKTGNETINGVKNFVSSPLVPAPTQNGEAANKAYADTKIAKASITPDFGSDTEKVISQKGYTDDMKAWLPSAVYSDRVTADSGTIRDKSLLNAMYDDALNLLPNTDLWYNFECGIKTRVSGLNTYVTKVYDLSANNRDATQATEASQPYLVGNINPANRQAIWGYGRLVTLPTIGYNNGSEWSVSLVGEQLYGLTLTSGAGSISLFGSAMYFVNSLGADVIIPYSGSVLNKTTRYMFVCKGNGEIEAWIDGKLAGKGVIADTSISISGIYSTQLKLKDIRFYNKALNKSEIEFLDAKMSAFYPQFEGVEIGNQVWEASSAMDTIAPDGTVIPEVTDNTAWAALTTPAWCYYNNSEANGAIYGRIYNGYAVQKLTGSPIWRAPMSADFSQLSAFLGGDAVAGGKLKAEGLTYWASPNTGATNESGFTAIAGGYRNASGLFTNIRLSDHYASTNESGIRFVYSTADIEPNARSIGYNANYGFYLRRIRRIPPGTNTREITSGAFSFPITGGAFKDIAIPNMYKITGVKITSENALTNIVLEIRTSAGVLVQNIMSGKSHAGSGKTILYSSILYDAEAMLQDYIVRATAVGNGGAGMEIELIIEKIKV